MPEYIKLTPEMYNLLTADICDEEFTAEQLLQMVTAARESIGKEEIIYG